MDTHTSPLTLAWDFDGFDTWKLTLPSVRLCAVVHKWKDDEEQCHWELSDTRGLDVLQSGDEESSMAAQARVIKVTRQRLRKALGVLEDL